MKKLLTILSLLLLITACKDKKEEYLKRDIESVKKGKFHVIRNFIDSQKHIQYYKDIEDFTEVREVFVQTINDSLQKLEVAINDLANKKFRTYDKKIEGYKEYVNDYFKINHKNILYSSVIHSYTDDFVVIFYNFNITQQNHYPYVNSVNMLINDTLRLKHDISVLDLKHADFDDTYIEEFTIHSQEDFGKALTDNLSDNIIYKLQGDKFSETRKVSKDEYKALAEVKDLYYLLNAKNDLIKMEKDVILYTK